MTSFILQNILVTFPKVHLFSTEAGLSSVGRRQQGAGWQWDTEAYFLMVGPVRTQPLREDTCLCMCVSYIPVDGMSQHQPAGVFSRLLLEL